VKFPYPVVPIRPTITTTMGRNGYQRDISWNWTFRSAPAFFGRDCFDALTSDRPYRPRLTTEEAFSMNKQGRGLSLRPARGRHLCGGISTDRAGRPEGWDESTGLVAVSRMEQKSHPHRARCVESYHRIGIVATLIHTEGSLRRPERRPKRSRRRLNACGSLVPATGFAFFRRDSLRRPSHVRAHVRRQEGILDGPHDSYGQPRHRWSAATRRVSI
jgi:hypothetical protein